MIRVEGVTKIFGPDPQSVIPLLEEGKTKSEIQSETGHIVGVNNASFELKAGEVFAIMGLSGSGKSTLIRCVNRLIEPTSGKVFLTDPEKGDQEVTGMDTAQLRLLRRHQMSMVFQHFALFPHRTVLSNTVYGLEIQGRGQKEREEIGRKMLEMVGLAEWADAYPSELSGGMQQRVGLARGLATEAKVLLMDEPFSALDPLIRVQMQEELKKIQAELERTILFITHDLDEAMTIGDKIAIMEAGEIIQIGTPEDILVNPRTEYVARFVEQADPTSVITADTIAVRFSDDVFETVREAEGIKYLARRAYPEIQFGIDSDGRPSKVLASDKDLTLENLSSVLSRGQRHSEERRRDDTVLVCSWDTVLRQLLQGRTHSTMPIIVTDDEGRAEGVVDEIELINGILEKRGASEEREQEGREKTPGKQSSVA